MPGYFSIERDLLLKPLWLDEPFTRGQAWVDLIGLANYAPNFIRVAGVRIDIMRGQCGWSEIKLSERWKWSRGKTRRFLNELERDQRVCINSTTRTTIITVCNYDAYQCAGTTDGTTDSTTDGQQTVQQTDTIKKNNKENKNNKRKKDPYSPQTENQIALDPSRDTNHTIDRFDEFWEVAARKIDKPKARKAFASALERAPAVTIITGMRRYAEARAEDDRPGSEKFTKHPTTWLNNDGWENEDIVDYQQHDYDEPGISPDERTRRILAYTGADP